MAAFLSSFIGEKAQFRLVGKADGTYWFCTDYCNVNKVTKADYFSLPKMEDCIGQVGPASFVSKFDLLKGSWQVPVSARAHEVLAFITPSGLYSYTVMSFDLKNASPPPGPPPATFQQLMNGVIVPLKGCPVYIDDVLSCLHS